MFMETILEFLKGAFVALTGALILHVYETLAKRLDARRKKSDLIAWAGRKEEAIKKVVGPHAWEFLQKEVLRVIRDEAERLISKEADRLGVEREQLAYESLKGFVSKFGLNLTERQIRQLIRKAVIVSGLDESLEEGTK